MLEEPASRWAIATVAVGVAVPFLALVAAVPIAWGRGLSWLDIAIAVVFYILEHEWPMVRNALESRLAKLRQGAE